MGNYLKIKNLLKVTACLILVALSGWVIWNFLAVILASNHGVDLTDEGLYLLASDPPEKYATWGFPFGWHTGPLFALVEYNIANFRTLGAFILFILGFWAGYQTAGLSWFWLRQSGNDLISKKSGIAFHALGALIGGVSVLMYYAGLLRTPSYNWLGLVGMTLACGGYVGSTRMLYLGRGRTVLVYCSTIALGLFLSLPAKPSIAPMAWMWGVGLWALLFSVKRSFLLSLIVAIQIVACVGLAWLVGLWAPDFHNYFLEWLSPEMPKFVPSHGVGGAVIAAMFVPWEFINALLSSPAANLAWVSALLAAAAWYSPLGRRWPYLTVCFAGVAIAASLVTAKIPQALLQTAPPVFRFTFSPAVTASIVVVVLVLLLASKTQANKQILCHQGFLFIGLLVYPVIFAFGTSTSPYAQGAMALVFIFLAGIVATASLSYRKAVGALLCLLAFATLLLAATLKDSWCMPYRMQPMNAQTSWVTFGTKKSGLFVDGTTAKALTKLQGDAEKAGWKDDTPLIGVCWSWSTTVPYVMGAKVPSSLILTLFGYKTSVDVGRYISDNYLTEFPASEAWILSGDISGLSTVPLSAKNANEKKHRIQISEQQQLLDHVSRLSGLQFPEDYFLVSSSEHLQLWKPRDLNQL